MTKEWTIECAVLLATACAYAEFGANVLIGVNYKADFGLSSGTYAQNDPGAETGTEDRYYDDGYNRVDSSGNFGGVTTYWGYQNASQYDAGGQTITMNSQRLSVSDDLRFQRDSNRAQPGLELWWQETILTGTRHDPYQPNPVWRKDAWMWYVDFRAALRWQFINIGQSGDVSGTLENVADVYSTGGATPPAAPFNGTFAGPNMALDAIPTSRTLSPVSGGSAVGSYDLDTHIFALDLGPAFIADLDYGARFSVSIGPSLAWAQSTFDYDYGRYGRGSSSEGSALLGWYASMEFLFAENMTLGFATYQMESIEIRNQGSYARLDSSDNYTFKIGLSF